MQNNDIYVMQPLRVSQTKKAPEGAFCLDMFAVNLWFQAHFVWQVESLVVAASRQVHLDVP